MTGRTKGRGKRRKKEGRKQKITLCLSKKEGGVKKEFLMKEVRTRTPPRKREKKGQKFCARAAEGAKEGRRNCDLAFQRTAREEKRKKKEKTQLDG